MKATVLRWGQSAYETDLDLSKEREGAASLGLGWRAAPESASPPPLDEVDALVVTSRVRVDREVLGQLRGHLVLTTTSGTDHIDLGAARALGVTVGRCPLARRDPVVEHALASLLGLLRRQPALLSAAAEGRWARGELPALAPRQVAGAPILVVGLGVIGARMSEILQALGAEVWGVDPAGVPTSVTAVALDEALSEAAAVTVHCALTPSSRGLFDVARISRMAPTAVLVNTARGGVVDPDAAVDAVRHGRLRGVALDVFPEEPWPGLSAAAGVPGVWLTPHASGYVHDLGDRVATEVLATLRAWVNGQPLPHAVA